MGHSLPRRASLLALPVVLFALVLSGAPLEAQPRTPAVITKTYLPQINQPSPQPGAVTFWGMNLYLSKRERRNAGDNRAVLGQLAAAAGVQWTREELPWDLIEPRDDQFSRVYDRDLLLAAEQGFGIVGMLLTTPAWARDAACLDDYWCPPADVAEFAEFAAWMVERGDAPIWVTELGWCTAPGACPDGVAIGEAEQAVYLARAVVITQQTGVAHLSWFQFEDAFDDPNRVWSNAAIVRGFNGSTYPVKPAYTAYKTLAAQLAGATPTGTGTLHSHTYDSSRDLDRGGVYHYRYVRGAASVDVVWSPNITGPGALPVAPGQRATLFRIDGTSTPLDTSAGTVTFGIGPSPILIVQEP